MALWTWFLSFGCGGVLLVFEWCRQQCGSNTSRRVCDLPETTLGGLHAAVQMCCGPNHVYSTKKLTGHMHTSEHRRFIRLSADGETVASARVFGVVELWCHGVSPSLLGVALIYCARGCGHGRWQRVMRATAPTLLTEIT